MRPSNEPPPSLLPYLTSCKLGWDALSAQACHEMPEIDGCPLPGDTDITLQLFTGGGLRWEMREVRAHSSWDGVDLRDGDFYMGPGTNVFYEQRWRSLSPEPTYSFALCLSQDLLAHTVEEV